MSTDFADSGRYTDAQMNMRKRLADAMIKNSMETTPIQSHWQGLSRLANALVGGYMAHKLGEEDKANKKAENDTFLAMFGEGPGSGSVGSMPSTTSPATPKPLSDTPTAASPTPRASTPTVSGDLGSKIDKYAADYGLDPKYLRAKVDIESGGDPKNVTGSYMGLGQLSKQEFAKYGGQGDIFDPDENLRVLALKTKAEKEDFVRKYGREPEPVELYLTHQQGQGGIDAHMRNPNAPAWQNMASTAEGRQKGEKWAKLAIWGNVPDADKRRFGSVENMTSKDFMDVWRARMDRGLTRAGGTAVAAAQPSPDGAPVQPEASDPMAAAQPPAPTQLAQAPTQTMTDASPPGATRPNLDPRIVAMLRSSNPKIQAAGRALALSTLQKSIKGADPAAQADLALKQAQLPKEMAEAELKRRELARADMTDAESAAKARKAEAEAKESTIKADKLKTRPQAYEQLKKALDEAASYPERYGTRAFNRAVGEYESNNDSTLSGDPVGYIGNKIAKLGGYVSEVLDGGASRKEVQAAVGGIQSELSQALRGITGMSAKEGDSNAELQNILKMVGDLPSASDKDDYRRRLDLVNTRVARFLAVDNREISPKPVSDAVPDAGPMASLPDALKALLVPGYAIADASRRAATATPPAWETAADPEPTDERQRLLRSLDRRQPR